MPSPEPTPEALVDAALEAHGRGDLDGAVAHCAAALALAPAHFVANHLRGALCLERNDPASALPWLQRAVALGPRSALAHQNLGRALWALDRREEALRQHQTAVALRPDGTEGLFDLASALQALGRAEEALAVWDRFLARVPESPAALMNKGVALADLQRPEAALACYDRALALAVPGPDLLLNRGAALIDLRRPQEALACFDRGLALAPDSADLHSNRGGALHRLGRHAEAREAYRAALSMDPGHLLAHTSLVGLLDYLPGVGLAELQSERRAFFEAHGRALAEAAPGHANDPDPERPLTVGYLGEDFRHHATASVFLPVLEHHDHARFRVAIYSGVRAEDGWTARCRAAADLWRPVHGLSDPGLADLIRADGVDVLVDLMGHTRGNRLLVFARRPAPVLVTAWGCGSGTGFPIMDALFSDPVAIPAADRALYAEPVVDLPCNLTFAAPDFAPAVVPPPCLARGSVTFGCLNRYAKVTRGVERLWARLLTLLPGSRLLLKDERFDNATGRKAVREAFGRLGVDPDRLVLRGGTSRPEHLATYGEVDIALDPFPQNGGVTTLEALWAGVPVVAVLGDTLASRVTGAILHALGLGDWAAADEEGCLRAALDLAGDPGRLAALRQELRPRLQASPVCDPVRYTRAVEAAYRDLWRAWTRRRGPA